VQLKRLLEQAGSSEESSLFKNTHPMKKGYRQKGEVFSIGKITADEDKRV